MPVLADEPRGQKRKRCFKCRSTDHMVSQCPAPCKNKKCIKCGSIDHKTAKCRYCTRHSPSPQEEGEIISPFAKAVQKPEMSLLDRISLLNKEQWFPEVCSCCGKVNPGHTDLGCPLYEQCQRCGGTGALGFLRKHTCEARKDTHKWDNQVNEADFDLYWNEYK